MTWEGCSFKCCLLCQRVGDNLSSVTRRTDIEREDHALCTRRFAPEPTRSWQTFAVEGQKLFIFSVCRPGELSQLLKFCSGEEEAIDNTQMNGCDWSSNKIYTSKWWSVLAWGPLSADHWPRTFFPQITAWCLFKCYLLINPLLNTQQSNNHALSPYPCQFFHGIYPFWTYLLICL